MRKILLLLALLGALLARVSAQEVTMEIVLDQEQYLRAEAVPVFVRISNLSGRTLRLGMDPNWLTFTVDADGVLLPRQGEGPVTRPFDLESSKTVTLRADLTQHFNLTELGRYTVTAKASLQQLNLGIGAKPKTFNIATGIKLWERDFGVPESNPPEARKYALQQVVFLKQKKIYVRVTNVDESKVFRVTPLGTLISFSQPEARVDQSSNLHVLFQDDARNFSYFIVNPSGDIIIRRAYDYTETRPQLAATQNGLILVTGGVRRVMPSDLPPPAAPKAASTNAIPVPK
ncbi:MAG: hypothetical protein EXS33_01140 [Pedosphaera sp.]|nr:hypothetical protein [Pedosphaera sp.]